MSLTEAAGTNRITLGRRLRRGRLTWRTETRGNVLAKLVDVKELRKLVGDGLKAGRPRNSAAKDKSRTKRKGK